MYILKTIKECESYKRYNLCISCSLFRMEYTYRKFEVYVNNLLSWCLQIPRTLPTAYIRLYVDASVLNDPSFIALFDKNIPHLEIVLYEFPDFLKTKGDEYFHDGTVGTMARFLVLYNEPKLPKNIEYTWITDVDMPIRIFNYSNIKELKRYNVDVSFISKSCYMYEWKNEKIDFPIMAGKIISKTKCKYSKVYFDKFLSEVLSGKYDKMKQGILSRLSEEKGKSHYMTNEQVKYFPYGFDELFTNHYLIKDIEKYKHLIYYDVSFKNANYMYKLINITELQKYESKIWYGQGKREVNHDKLVELLDIAYEDVPDEYKSRKCFSEYEKYRSKFSTSPSTWSVMALIKV